MSENFSANALSKHSVHNLLEAGEVCACDKIVVHLVFGKNVGDLLVNVCHDGFELSVHLPLPTRTVFRCSETFPDRRPQRRPR